MRPPSSAPTTSARATSSCSVTTPRMVQAAPSIVSVAGLAKSNCWDGLPIWLLPCREKMGLQRIELDALPLRSVIWLSCMPKFRIDTIADLSRQLSFSPHDTRAAQVQSAEDLLHLIDPSKAYPLEFV